MSHRSKTKADHRECSWSRVERYKAIRKPRCNGGDGCWRCWDKWHIVQRRGGRDDRPAGTEGSSMPRPRAQGYTEAWLCQ